jgi:hypothetical protein
MPERLPSWKGASGSWKPSHSWNGIPSQAECLEGPRMAPGSQLPPGRGFLMGSPGSGMLALAQYSGAYLLHELFCVFQAGAIANWTAWHPSGSESCSAMQSTRAFNTCSV